MDKEIEEQRYGRSKNTAINYGYICSGSYRKKFDSISDNPQLNRLLYKLAKKILMHRSGTNYEDMYWIDLDKIEVVSEEISSDVEEMIIYTQKTEQVIKKYDHLLTIHSHPKSFPPSVADLNANYRNQYLLGIVICHDGKIFTYKANEELSESYFNLRVADHLRRGYNEFEAQKRTLEEICTKFDVEFQEVVCGDL